MGYILNFTVRRNMLTYTFGLIHICQRKATSQYFLIKPIISRTARRLYLDTIKKKKKKTKKKKKKNTPKTPKIKQCLVNEVMYL